MLVLLIFIGTLLLSFLITSLIIWLICWCFSLTFSWTMALGIWLVLLLLKSVFRK
jgi:hypothetical protein